MKADYERGMRQLSRMAGARGHRLPLDLRRLTLQHLDGSNMPLSSQHGGAKNGNSNVAASFGKVIKKYHTTNRKFKNSVEMVLQDLGQAVCDFIGARKVQKESFHRVFGRLEALPGLHQVDAASKVIAPTGTLAPIPGNQFSMEYDSATLYN